MLHRFRLRKIKINKTQQTLALLLEGTFLSFPCGFFFFLTTNRSFVKNTKKPAIHTHAFFPSLRFYGERVCPSTLLHVSKWICVHAQVQLSLYTYLSSEFIGTATIYTTIRRVGTVLQLMHTLKYYYWAINPLECSGISPKGLGMFTQDLHTMEHAV